MVVLPPGFVAVRYPGYFWNIPEQKLYSLKSGTLKPLVMKKRWRDRPECYQISHEGISRTMSKEWLSKMKYPAKVEVFPVKI